MRRGLDYHIHTFYQRCGNETLTVENIIRRAEALGLRSIAITDHLNTLDMLPNFRLIKRDIEAIETAIDVLFGCELNHQGCDGPWAYSEEIRDDYAFQIAIGGTHHAYTDSLDPTELIDVQHRHHMRALTDPLVDILVHPYWVPHEDWTKRSPHWWADLLGNMPDSRINELASASAANHCAIEVNAHFFCYSDYYGLPFSQNYVHFIARLRDAGAYLAAGSDAHDINVLGQTDYVEGLLDGLGVPESQIWRPNERN